MRFRRHQEAAQASTRRLLALFVVLLAGLVVAVNAALAGVYWLSFPFAYAYPRLFFETNTALVLLFVLGGCWLEGVRLREGGAHVARMAGGRPAQVSGHTAGDRLERRLHNIVHEMALASRIPAPAAWVLPRDDAINAFAAGWSADDAVIAVTRGALERLTREELQGVLAHEFSHLVHGDTRLNMRLIGLVWGLQMVFMLGRSLSQPNDEGHRPATSLFGWALMATGSLGWATGRLLQAAVSRQREFLADASAVKYTRMVDGLGGALRKIAHQARRHRDGLHAAQGASLAHLFLSAPGGAHWWSTHPPIAVRLQRLYGCDVDPLPADVLPAPPADEPLLAFAPRDSVASPPAAAHPIAAARHDPAQNPGWHGDAAREKDALERIARWHGAGERQAALVLLLTALDAPTAHGVPDGLVATARRELQALSLASRWAVFTTLAAQVRSAPAAQRHMLRSAARGAARDASVRLRRLALGRWVRAAPVVAWRRARDLGTLQAEIGAATLHLASAMGMAPDEARGWHDSVMHMLGAAPGRSRASLLGALRLRRLSPMQRPQLARAWVHALPAARFADERVAETLLWACRLLDTPLPAPLEQRVAPFQ